MVGDSMNIEYELLKIYGKNKKNIQKASVLMQEHIDSNYYEIPEIQEICKELDVVIFYEELQDDGNSETVLINNKGRLVSQHKCSLENIRQTRLKIEESEIDEVFNKKEIKLINKNLKDFNITMEEFVEDNIDEFLYDLYENKKSMVINNIEKYYK